MVRLSFQSSFINHQSSESGRSSSIRNVSQIVSLGFESSLVTVTFWAKKLPVIRLHFLCTFGDSYGGRRWFILSTQISQITIKGGRKMVAVFGVWLLKKRLKQIGGFLGLFLGMLQNTAAFAENSKEDPRIEASFWTSTDDWYGERLNFGIDYYGELLNQVCIYPVNRSINVVVVYRVGELIKSEVKPLEVNCSFDGPPKRAWLYEYRFERYGVEGLFHELRQAHENGVPFKIELAFVDAYGNWDSRKGKNYHVQLLP
jgi:hypothetical protein